MKKFFTLLCMALVGAVAFAQDAYDPTEKTAYVSGTDNLCSGNWSAEDAMTYDASDGLWKITLAAKDTKVIEYKIVYEGEWYGNEKGDNYQFMVSEPSDVLITFDPNTLQSTYTGSKIVAYDPNKIDFVIAAGSDALLNGVNWDVTEEGGGVNKLTEVDEGYYELELKGVAAGSYNFKFAANGSWAKQWGAQDGSENLENGVAVPAQGGSNPANFAITLPKGFTYDVTLTLDIMNPDDPMVTAAWVEAGTAEITDDIYSIAGSMNGWDQTDASTEMTQQADGLFYYTFTGLEAGDYQFKVVVNHDWTVSYGWDGDNAYFHTDGEDVTIIFNAETGVVSVGEVTNIYSVAGNFNGWNEKDAATEMTKNADGTYSYVTTLEAGSYEYKVVVNHDWSESYGDGGSNATFTLEASSEVTFTFNPETKAVSAVVGDGDGIRGIEAQQQHSGIYTLAGQRVEKTVRGLYIVNGKKVVIK